ncbi:uncharacterized protein LOC135829468 isoform X2 [Sycon ciliatum]|uniref:uncharacterized protein LOC135829468 isoform X2 n=1 Tax=Sycon ciliatum TaxID=27933 RepID=UPI0031F716B1
MAERQSSVIAQPGAGLTGTAENCLKPGEDERVTVNEPPAETSSPFHSIFALEVGCDNCDKGQPLPLAYQGTCFLLSDLNCRKEEYIFATAAHNLFCDDCGEWLWVQIYSDLSQEQFLTMGKISRKNKNGWLIVADWYKENAKDAKKKSNPDLFRHDYGIITAKKSRCKCPLAYWADKNLLGVATQCQKNEDDVRMCGYPMDTYYGGKEERAEKRKYWVDKPRPATFAEHSHQLHHFVDSSPGQSGSPVFLLPKEGEAETASATGYVVGIHVKGADERNSAVKLRDEHGRDTKPMEDLRNWAKDPSPWLPAKNVEVAEKSVKRVVRRSEQKGMHGGRLHQQQQADSGAEAPTTKEPKKKYESLVQQLSDRTGWESGVFRKLVPDLVSMLTPAAMLRQCEAEELITFDQRQLFATYPGPAAQNEALLDALRLGDDASFHTFLECIRKVEPPASARRLLAKLEPVDKFRSTAEAASASAGASAADPVVKRGAQQQADSGAEAPTTKEPKKKFYENPFKDPDYVAKIDVPLKDLDGVELRRSLQPKNVLTQDQVKRLEKMSSETHNYNMIGWIQLSRRRGYVALCEVIQEWGVEPELLEDMNNLLPPELRVGKGCAAALRSPSELEAAEQEAARLEAKRGARLSNNAMHEATNMTLSSGLTRVRRIRISLCGQFGTGKTSLADSLKNKQFMDKRASTPALAVDHGNVLHGSGNLTDWEFNAAFLYTPGILVRAEDLEKKHQQREQEAKRAGPTGLQRTGTATQEAAFPAAKQTLKLGKGPEAAPSSAELTQSLIDVILENQELMRDIGEEEVVVSIWDCGGQSIFSSLQHFLMGKDYVIYILCFNASENFQLTKQQNYWKWSGSTLSEMTLDVPEELENIDHIRHWLTAIHFASNPGKAVESEAFDYPPVILVGNFADKLSTDRTLSEHKVDILEKLGKLCRRSPTFQGMLKRKNIDPAGLFLVDNHESGASQEVRGILKKLQGAVSSVLANKEIPTEWVRFEMIMEYLKKQPTHTGYTTRDSMKTLVEKACKIRDDFGMDGAPSEFERLLRFYDDLRVIIYRPADKNSPQPDDIIFHNTQWLIRQINVLVFGHMYPVEPGGGDGWTAKEAGTAETDWRNYLWSKGIARWQLMKCAWEAVKIEVRNKMLDVMVDWDLLYKFGDASDAKYFIPSALQRRPPKKIEEALRSFQQDNEPNDVCFSTADTPLLIMVQPPGKHEEDHLDYNDPGADTPMPHSSYFKLLVRLMRKWNITNTDRSRCEFTYNTARFRLWLPEQFPGKVDIFLAHYDSSGAMLVSVNFRCSPDCAASDSNWLRPISSICQYIRKVIMEELGKLENPKLDKPVMFSLPLPPVCKCKAQEWKDYSSESRDLGYAPWRVRYSESGALHDSFCNVCKLTYSMPNNSNCWFKASSSFQLEGQQNAVARKQVAIWEKKAEIANDESLPTEVKKFLADRADKCLCMLAGSRDTLAVASPSFGTIEPAVGLESWKLCCQYVVAGHSDVILRVARMCDTQQSEDELVHDLRRFCEEKQRGSSERSEAEAPTATKKKFKRGVKHGARRSEQKGMHGDRLHQQQQADSEAEAPTVTKKKFKRGVKHGARRSEQKGMHGGRLHQQQQADSEAEAPTATKKKFKRGVKRGARRSEQKGMHGGRLHQQQQADGGAEVPTARLPTTKEPKKKLKLGVRRGVKRSEQKGMHRGRLHQQQQADGGAEAPTARLPTTKEPKKKLKLRVRRGVKRSEQKGMHRGRLHQQQQADGGAEAPTGRLPMTKEPKKKLKLRVRRGVKRSEQKGMHRGRLHQQQQADSEAEAPTATKKKFKRGVKRGARRSEQKGMHGGRLHQQQQADSRAEAPPAKKKMFYDDPFDHPDYVAKIDLPLKDLDGVELRRRLQTKGKLTKSQVRRLEKMSSETAHNNEMIGWIQDYHRDGYVALCEIIQEWGVVPELLEDMKNLL